MRKLRVGLLTLLCALIFHVESVRAETFNVTNASELAADLATAQNNNEDDTINIASGNYDASSATFTYLADNIGGSEENFSLTLIGEDRETTILDGGDLNQVMLIRTINLSSGDDQVDITVRNLTFRKGNASGAEVIGGGLAVEGSQANVLVDNCIFRDNFADSFGGGADLAAELGNVTLTDSVFIGNSANVDAAGVELFGNTTLIATNNVFFDNHAGAGVGGGALIQFNSGDGVGDEILIVNNTFVSNSAGGDGGGLYVALSDGDPERADIFNNIIFGNAATGGGDLFVEDTVSAVLGGTVLLSHNNIGDLFLECASLGGCVSNVTEEANLGEDPGLVDPAGGDFHLDAGSPMIDKGSASAPSLPSSDFEGDDRDQGDAPDIGADEVDVGGGGGDGSGCSLVR